MMDDLFVLTLDWALLLLLLRRSPPPPLNSELEPKGRVKAWPNETHFKLGYGESNESIDPSYRVSIGRGLSSSVTVL